MNRQARLYSLGLRPVYRVIPRGKCWLRVQGPTSWNKGNAGLEVNFQHTFNSSSEERVYFAFTYPFSYHDIQEKTSKIEEKVRDESYNYIYFHRELLGYSVEKRRVELLTITSTEGISTEKEDLIEN